MDIDNDDMPLYNGDRKPYYSCNTVLKFEFTGSMLIMISFDGFTIEEGSPIYMQILLYIKRCIVAGTIADGDELPSRRVLSALLGVNPNTIQKAYRMLEEEQLIQSRSGAKSYMVVDEEKSRKIRQELLENDIMNIISSMKQMALTKEQAVELLNKYWD